MFKKIVLSILLVVILGGAYVVYDMYKKVYQPNVTLKNSTSPYFYI
jgi:hypothetical protein